MKLYVRIYAFCFVLLGGLNVFAAQLEDDMSLVMGLDGLYNENFEESRDNFLVLFEDTKEPYYAKLAAQAAVGVGDLELAMRLSVLYQELSKDNDDLITNKILIDGFIQLGEHNKATQLLEKVIRQERTPQALRILANLYAMQKKFTKALLLFNEVYQQENDEDSLKKIILIHIGENKIQEALGTLSQHLLNHGCSESFCDESLKFYRDLEGLDMARGVFENIYSKSPTIQNAINLIRVLVSLKQYQQAQGIAQSFPFDKGLLLDLYVMQGDFQKATLQAGAIYEESKNPKFLALQAVYEISSNQNISKESAKSAINKLQRAIKERHKELAHNKQKPTTQDAFFYNFLGYLMIDSGFDVKKGISFVQDALAIESNSVAYLDSLAWGYYKLGNCDEAKKIFNQIPHDKISKDAELSEHWTHIKQCAKP